MWKVISPDGWGSSVAHRDLRFDPLVGRISSLVKKILSLCLVRSRVPSPARHPPVQAILEWAVVASLLVMRGQGSGVFLIGTCWFRDFLSHQWVVCALSADRRQCQWGRLYPPRLSFFQSFKILGFCILEASLRLQWVIKFRGHTRWQHCNS
jgi:hypothetical protein